jgi:hypothetical protein
MIKRLAEDRPGAITVTMLLLPLLLLLTMIMMMMMMAMMMMIIRFSYLPMLFIIPSSHPPPSLSAPLPFRPPISCSVVLFADLHGHSRRKNIFLYGCR